MSATGSVARRLKTLQAGLRQLAVDMGNEKNPDVWDYAEAIGELVDESEAGDVDPTSTRESAE